MTDDVRDRILGLLHAGPATVAGLSARLGVPGGVVSYHLKMLEQAGLVRVGATRVEGGVTVARYVSTAAAASPPVRVPAPLPGLTWTGTGDFPVPVWTTAVPPAAAMSSGSAPAPTEAEPAPTEAEPAPTEAEPKPDERHPHLIPRQTARQTTRQAQTPRLVDVRRVPMDDATLYEFAGRLDALAREFAARATPGAPAAELTVALYRPAGEAATGQGS